jgi:acyl carrier protein
VPHANADTLHVPVGKPIRNMRVYILDGQNRICGIGVRGVICVAGPGVGKGYWKDEQKTNASFVANPFSAGDPDYEVLYKTGDIGYYREDGNIICLGRVDEQVKVRGYRIEPAEIEHCLCSYAAVRACVVVVKELFGEPALVAYYLAEPAIDEKGLTDHLQQFLPAYMIPTYYVHIQEIPVTANGKLRRDALPDPQAKEILYKPPITDTEKKLVHIWSQVLKIDADAVGIDRSFFELGGHSLRATALVSRMKKEFDIDIPLREVFILPTVQQMAEHIDNKKWVLGKTEKHVALSNEVILD